jgi:hypothetical protein
LLFITPSKYLSAEYALALREFIIDNYSLEKIADFSSVRVFESAGVSTMISHFANRKQNKNVEFTTFETTTRKASSHVYSHKVLSALPNNLWGALLSSSIELFLKISEKSDVIDDYADVNACSTASEAEFFEKSLKELSQDNSFKYINNGTINRYVQLWGEKPLRVNKMLHPYLGYEFMTQRRKEMFTSPKLLFVKLAKCPQVFFDEEGIYASANTNMLYNLKNYDYKFLLGYLNSRLFNFVYHTMFGGLSMLGSIQMQAPQIRKSLIPKWDNVYNNQ